MTENDRIRAIKQYGGMHLKQFSRNNITYKMCIEAVRDDADSILYTPKEYLDENLYKSMCESPIHPGLKYVPSEYKTEEICKLAVRSNGLNLKDVPELYKSKQLCEMAIENNVYALPAVPSQYIEPKMVVDLIQNNKLSDELYRLEKLTKIDKKELEAKRSGIFVLSLLPNDFKKTTFYEEVCKEIPEVIKFLPKKNRTASLCKTVIKGLKLKDSAEVAALYPDYFELFHDSLYSHDSCLAFVKTNFFKSEFEAKPYSNPFDITTINLQKLVQWPDVAENAIKIRATFLRYVDENIITYDLCKLAVKDGFSLQYIPQKFYDKELCEIAVKTSAYNLKFVPEEYKTYDMCLGAVSYTHYVIEWVPEKYKTRELYLKSLKYPIYDFDFIPSEIIDKEIALAIIASAEKLLSEVLRIIPENVRDEDVCKKAIEFRGCNIKYVPDKYKTYELCIDAAKKDYPYFKDASYIPYDFFTPEMCLLCISDFENIPKGKLTYEACLALIEQDEEYGPGYLYLVPNELMTQEICDKAVHKTSWNLQYVPEKFITKDLLSFVACSMPGRLKDNFPEKFATKEYIDELKAKFPEDEYYFNEIYSKYHHS